jgi:Mn2+/Fe2+ NRAMP family transporter
MTEQSLDDLLRIVGVVLGAFLLFFPRAFTYLASYGGLIKYQPPNWMMWTTRACAAVMLVFSLKDLMSR